MNSDYASDLDEYRSLVRYIFMLAGGAMSWKMSIQDYIALSLTKAKYMALIFIVKEMIWLRGLLSNFGLDQKIVDIHYDNLDAIYLACNPIYLERTKVINIKHHFIQSVLAKGKVIVKKIATSENLAYMITKLVSLAKLEHI